MNELRNSLIVIGLTLRTFSIAVSECFSNAHATNVDLRSGKPVPDRTPPDQHYYRNTDVVARDLSGRWHVVSVDPVIYYPQAKECKA